MARDDRAWRRKVTCVQLVIGAAQAARLDAQQTAQGSELGQREALSFELSWCLQHHRDCFVSHGDLLHCETQITSRAGAESVVAGPRDLRIGDRDLGVDAAACLVHERHGVAVQRDRWVL